MAKKTKITTSNIIKSMGLEEEKNIVLTCGTTEDTIEISVKPRLSLQERTNMIQDILSMVFFETPDGAISYHPEFKKFAFEYEIVNYFTDISLPTNGGKAWDFLEKTCIASRIAGVVRDNCVNEIIAEANEMIEYKKQEILNASKFTQIFDSFTDLLKAAKSVLKDIKFEEVVSYLGKEDPKLKDKLKNILESTIAETSAD